MRIAIDMQGAQSSGSWNRGIGRYAMAIASAIVRNKGDHEVLLVLNGAFKDSIVRIRTAFADLVPTEKIHVWHSVTPTAYGVASNCWRRRSAELMRDAFLASLKPDVVLITSLIEGHGDDAVTSITNTSSNYVVATIFFDLIPLIYQQHYLSDHTVRQWYFSKIEQLKCADLWLAISEATRQDGIRHLGLPTDACLNISTDADRHFGVVSMSTQHISEIRQKYNLSRDFIMYTGGIDMRKNLEGLIRAYSLLGRELRAKHQLAIVCSIGDEYRQRLLHLAANHGLVHNEVILTSFVPDEDLKALYNLCSLFVFPSFYEGFGLPLLEAMRCGAPVIASNTSSLVEVVGRPDALFDPSSDQAIAKLIHRSLTDAEYHNELRIHAARQAATFSWDESAKRAIKAMEDKFAQLNGQVHQSREGQTKPTLAYISPLPPQRSVIADYSAELLPYLAKHYRVEVIVNTDNDTDAWINATIPIRSVEWFTENSNKFDRVIYQFGNSLFHEHMFALLEKIPGVLVLHDFFLSGVLRAMAARGNHAAFLHHLYQSHGYRALHQLSNAAVDSDAVMRFPCSGDVVAGSLGLIVHSGYAARLASQWYGLSSAHHAIAPLVRLPDQTSSKAAARASLGMNDDDFIVCSLGIVDPNKLHHRIVEAWLDSELAEQNGSRLLIVGECSVDTYSAHIRERIQSHPLGDTVEIIGWVEPDRYKSYLVAADVGVQLRKSSKGETSAAVIDCMNHGLATIVNANGSMAELNDRCVLILPEEFSTDELTHALELLWRDSALRSRLGENAREEVHARHNPESCAEAYKLAIEKFYSATRLFPPELIDRIATIEDGSPSDEDLLSLAQCVEQSYPLPFKQHQLLLDVSDLFDMVDSEQPIRFSKTLLKWLDNCPSGWRVEPVYTPGTSSYQYARKFTASLLGVSTDFLSDSAVRCNPGDLLVCLVLQSSPETQHSQVHPLELQGVKSIRLTMEELWSQRIDDLIKNL